MEKLLITFLLLVTINSYCQFQIDTFKNVDNELYVITKDWMGVKYRVGGSSKNGIDCSRFSKMIYMTRYNVEIPNTAREQYRITSRIKKDSLVTGDLVFFRTNTRSGWHVGVYLIDGYFIHSSNRKYGVKISNLSTPYYLRTYIGGGRI